MLVMLIKLWGMAGCLQIVTGYYSVELRKGSSVRYSFQVMFWGLHVSLVTIMEKLHFRLYLNPNLFLYSFNNS